MRFCFNAVVAFCTVATAGPAAGKEEAEGGAASKFAVDSDAAIVIFRSGTISIAVHH